MSVYYYDVPASATPSPDLGLTSREQRLRDGRLLDLSRIACEAGFRAPVAISKEGLGACLAGLTDAGHDAIHAPCSSCVAARRMWSVLRSAAAEVMHRHEDRTVYFSARLESDDANAAPASEVHLKLVIDAGTTDRPVATILLPDQD
ncbi:DUF6573 family protein [Paraburkholderia sp. 32]|uniref:DUF6573 family protein n=1 Tax=unclassified Paraburkholderia TaxID=2615204 RepID=UPI003D1983C8